MRPIHFVYNPVSWSAGRQVDGGMADALVQPILAHLPPGSATIGNLPKPGAVNVFYQWHGPTGTPIPGEGSSVFISHGIADKNWRDEPKVRAFDLVVVSGPAWVRKLVAQGMDPHRILELGYPKLDPIFAGDVVPTEHRRPTIVWAPTHGGRRSVSTWPQCQELARKLLSEWDVQIAPHPRHRPDGRSTVQELADADVVIADGGSTIYEAWALGKPVVFCDWLTRRGVLLAAHPLWGSFESQVYSAEIGYHADRPDQLASQVRRALAKGIDDRAREFIEGIFPARLRGCSGSAHATALMEIASGKSPRTLSLSPQELSAIQRKILRPGDALIVNVGDRVIQRGGMVFVPGEPVTTALSGYKLREVRACRDLVVW